MRCVAVKPSYASFRISIVFPFLQIRTIVRFVNLISRKPHLLWFQEFDKELHWHKFLPEREEKVNKIIWSAKHAGGGGGCVLFVWWLEGNGWVGWGRRTRIARAGRRHPPYSYQVVTPHHHPSEHQQNPPIITARALLPAFRLGPYSKRQKGGEVHRNTCFELSDWNGTVWAEIFSVFGWWEALATQWPS